MTEATGPQAGDDPGGPAGPRPPTTTGGAALTHCGVKSVPRDPLTRNYISDMVPNPEHRR